MSQRNNGSSAIIKNYLCNNILSQNNSNMNYIYLCSKLKPLSENFGISNQTRNIILFEKFNQIRLRALAHNTYYNYKFLFIEKKRSKNSK